MQAVAQACLSGEINADVALVLSNRKEAGGLAVAENLGIATAVVEHVAYPSREAFDTALTHAMEQIDPDWIVLAGFMRILGTRFVERWQGRIINIHPSLLPRHPGLNTHARAIDAGDVESGASVHLVTLELDAGPVIAQTRVPIVPDDTPDTLAARVIAQEHRLYVKALKQCVNVPEP